MKKISIILVIAAMTGLSSCVSSPKANLKTDVDSLSYAIGIVQTDGLKNYLVGRLNMDTTYMSDFIRGLNVGVDKTGEKDIAYIAGLQIGQQISNQILTAFNNDIFMGDSTKTLSKDNFMAGFISGTLGKDTDMAMTEARIYMRTNMDRIKETEIERKYHDYKIENEQFLEENKSKEGVITTPSGLQYKVITMGKGQIPNDSCKVQVNYRGIMIDSTEFDSSYKRKKPATFRVNQVVKGWTEALTMMPVGSKWELYVPQELGYGSKETGKIKPYSTLIFEVELVGIVEPKKNKKK